MYTQKPAFNAHTCFCVYTSRSFQIDTSPGLATLLVTSGVCTQSASFVYAQGGFNAEVQAPTRFAAHAAAGGGRGGRASAGEARASAGEADSKERRPKDGGKLSAPRHPHAAECCA